VSASGLPVLGPVIAGPSRGITLFATLGMIARHICDHFVLGISIPGAPLRLRALQATGLAAKLLRPVADHERRAADDTAFGQLIAAHSGNPLSF